MPRLYEFMIYYIIPTIIIIISLIIIIFIIIKKLPNLAAINVESIAKEKESKVRNRIIVERLGRKFFGLKKILNEFFRPLAKSLTAGWNSFYQKITKLEKENLKKSQRGPLKKIDINQGIKEKLETAAKFLADQDFTKAEEVCINIIELNSKNLDAYEILSEIYKEKKEYKKARETCRYVIKLLTKNNAEMEGNGKKHHLADCYADLGIIYQLENKHNFALKNFQKAVEFEPHNPRFLDLLLKICIIVKNKNLALQTFSSLKKADPDNQRLAELKDQINTINS